MTPNAGLRTAVLEALRPHLGRYTQGGADRGLAFWPPSLTASLEPPADYKASGLEAILRLLPEDFDGRYEFGDTGVVGVLHYPVTLKAWSGSTWNGREALIEAFGLLTTNLARRPRFVPGNAEFVETLTLLIPVQS